MNPPWGEMLTVPVPSGPITVVVVERVGVDLPGYPAYAKATCVGPCDEWVWLGKKSLEAVTTGEALPLCQQCAQLAITAGRAEQAGHIEEDP